MRGGVDLTSRGTYTPEKTVKDGNAALTLVLRGASGGHSGMDIHKGLANANKLMNRVLLEALDHVDLRVAEIHGGGLRNAIPRESRTTLVFAESDRDALVAALTASGATLQAEYATTDPELVLEWGRRTCLRSCWEKTTNTPSCWPSKRALWAFTA